MAELTILIMYNEPVLDPTHPDYASEADVLYSAKVVQESLTRKSISSDVFGVTDDLSALLRRLAKGGFDLVFNLYEGTADNPITEVYFTGLLEWLQIPFTGNASRALSLAREKIICKRLFQSVGVLTPSFFVVEGNAPVTNSLGWPVIVKLSAEDASVGIDQGSVVQTNEELNQRLDYLRQHYGPQPILVEQYIVGRELQLSLIDVHESAKVLMLPPAEVQYSSTETNKYWPIYSYTAKWDESSAEHLAAPVVVGIDLPEPWLEQLESTAIAAYRTLGCRDYARVDTRVTPNGEIYVLEINPNPSITSLMIDQGLRLLGYSYDDFILGLARCADARKKPRLGHRRIRAQAVLTPNSVSEQLSDNLPAPS